MCVSVGVCGCVWGVRVCVLGCACVFGVLGGVCECVCVCFWDVRGVFGVLGV